MERENLDAYERASKRRTREHTSPEKIQKVMKIGERCPLRSAGRRGGQLIRKRIGRGLERL
jgi:hypothetical protein